MKQFIKLTTLTGGFIVVNLTFLSPVKAEVCNNYTVRDLQDNSVNLRANPNGRIVRALRNGSQVTSTGAESNGWLPVKVGTSGSRGWMDSSRLTQNVDYVVFDPDDSFVNVLEKPNGKIIVRVPNGTTIPEPMNYIRDWAVVPQLNGVIQGRSIRQPDCLQ
ncbi:SH3 domain-containing protein [Microcoleus sp. FACHB-831]|jgi:hypothetical protein|uniref:SH3 domain-containing protein n=1 Tax=Microcoleus sp. FACHB-831 TaxID=2692827 RepID=UPI00168232FE|nr:SH3 domain-containing protein [Microcoleus sp. FACHB-831]MBD1923565.1 SH3 domain-containing protein [Microcoleus sp. FACHB-831]